jgi:hypothetical protein
MLGCERFAKETGQQLINFYSEDVCKPINDNVENGKGRVRIPKHRTQVKKMTDKLQKLSELSLQVPPVTW